MVIVLRIVVLTFILCFCTLSNVSAEKKLDTLIISGLNNTSLEMINKNITLSRGSLISIADVQQTIKSLYRLGLFRSIDLVILSESDSTITLQMNVVENPFCDGIEFVGVKKLKTKDILEKMTLKKSSIVSEATLHENSIIIKKLYTKEGYLLADIKTETVQTKNPNAVIIKYTIKEGTKVRIKSVAFHGNTEIKESKLKGKFKTKSKHLFNSGEYKTELFEKHLDSLMMFYHDQGYLDARVVKDSVIYDSNGKDIHIDITLDEGKRYYAGDFYFSGNTIIPTELLSSQIAMKRGKPFDKTKFEMTKHLIGNVYRDEGYLWAQAQDQNSYRNDTIDVTFTLVEGKAAVVRKIDVRGNDKTRENVVRREVTLYPGQKYKQSGMETSIQRLYRLNFFSSVTPDLRPNDDGTIDLLYTVEEKDNIGQLQVGATYSALDAFGATFSIGIPNFRGAGENLTVKIDLTKPRQVISLGFTEPWIFNTPTAFSIDNFYERRNTDFEDYTKVWSDLSVSRRLKWPDEWYSAAVGYIIGYNKNYNKNNDLLLVSKDLKNKGFFIPQKGVLSKAYFVLSRDDRDLVSFATKGSIATLRTEIAGLGGQYHFVKGMMNYEMFFPVFWKFVLSARSLLGVIDGFSFRKNIEWDDLFSAGGFVGAGQFDPIIRGYPDLIWGRGRGEYKDAEFDGTTFLNMSFVLRVPIVEQQLYLGAFADYGRVWNSVREIDLGRMFPGAGLGFRLNLPMIGLMGMDVAWPFKDPTDPHFNETIAGNPRWHFVMMRDF